MSISISGNGGITGATSNYSFDQSVSIGGTLTYEDVTNIDSVGVITARSGINVGPLVSIAATINANGSATFANTVQVGDWASGGFGCALNHIGVVQSRRSGGDLFQGYSSSGKTSAIQSDGDAHFLGRVGIGTDNPGRALEIGTTGPAIKFDNGTNAWSIGTGAFIDGSDSFVFFEEGIGERMRIDSSGRLLLGTSSARSFIGGALNPQFQIEGTDDNSSIFSITRNSNNTGTPRLIFGKTRGTANGAVTVVSSGDVLGSLLFDGADGTDTATAAAIDCAVDGTPGSNDMPGRLVFSTTADGAATPTERMRIDSSGQFEMNGVRNIYESFFITGNQAYNWDFTVPAEGSWGNSFYLIAGFNHYYTTAYGAHRSAWFSARGTNVGAVLDQNQTHSQSGGWTVSKPNTTTFRVTKSAGSLDAPGYGFFQLKFNNF